MVLEVVKYGHPALRERGARIETITPELRQFIADMFDTMHAAKGIGLAAQQVGRAIQLTVLDVRGVADRPSRLLLHGRPADVDAFMPLVLINPEIMPVGELDTGPEGCLSFPEVYADVTRPDGARVKALNAEGQTLEFECGGLLSRAIQHEVDHLHGILFIDRMTRQVKAGIRDEIDAIAEATRAALAKKR